MPLKKNICQHTILNSVSWGQLFHLVSLPVDHLPTMEQHLDPAGETCVLEQPVKENPIIKDF